MSDIFSFIDPNTMLLGLLFVIFFVFIQLALSKTLKDKKTSGIIAFCISLLAVYGISRSNLDVSGIFYNIGITEEMIYTIVPFIILAGLIFMIWKLRLSRTLMLAGIFLIIASFFVYEQTWVLILGIVLFIIGLILWIRERRNPQNKPGGGGGGNKGRDALIKAAKQFHDWATRQPNPKFVGNWAKFINWLGNGTKSETQLCGIYGVSQSEFVSIFNRYGKV